MNLRLTVLLAAMSSTALSAPPNLTFKPADDGSFAFDTGVVKGRLQADDKSQGIPTFRDSKTGAELAYGGSNPGLLSYYRLFSAGQRWKDAAGDTMRRMPRVAKLLPDGAVRIRWPAAADHPIEITAAYRWKAPNIIDLTTTIKPTRDLADIEVFLSSYFAKNFRARVYLESPRHTRGKDAFMSPDANPLLVGTYLAFPRDLPSAHIFYDGRWEQGTSPVQWSISRYYAAPLVMQSDAKTGITFVLMTRPQDCFAVDMPYNIEPPDGVAGHRSTYFSLFGQDLKAGQSAVAHTRLIVGPNVTDADALKAYNDFLAEKP